MPTRRKASQPAEGRTTRMRSKLLLKGEDDLQEECSYPPINQHFDTTKKSYIDNNGHSNLNKINIPNGSKIPNSRDLKTTTQNAKGNSSLYAAIIKSEACSSEALQSFSKYKIECVCYIYIFLSWLAHQCILQNKTTSYDFNVGYLMIGHITWTLLLGVTADFVSIKATCCLKITAWLACLLSSFTVYADVTGILSRILLCSGLLVTQISLCHDSHTCGLSLARVSAFRCLLASRRVIASVCDGVRILVLSLGSYKWDVLKSWHGTILGFLSLCDVLSEWFMEQLLFPCLVVGLIMCLVYLSTRSTASSKDSDPECKKESVINNIAVAVICKFCLSFPSMLIVYNKKSFVSIYSEVINASAIGVHLVVFPLLAWLSAGRDSAKIGFLLLGAGYAFMACSSSVSSTIVAALCGMVAMTQCSMMARVAAGKLPAVMFSLMFVLHLTLRMFADAFQSDVKYYVSQVPILALFPDFVSGHEIGVLGTILSSLALLTMYCC